MGYVIWYPAHHVAFPRFEVGDQYVKVNHCKICFKATFQMFKAKGKLWYGIYMFSHDLAQIKNTMSNMSLKPRESKRAG